MPNAASKRKATPHHSHVKRATELARSASEKGSELSFRVLEDGKSVTQRRPKPLTRPPSRGNVRSRQHQVLAAATPAFGSASDTTTSQLTEAGPVFGDVLRSIALAVADTQTALDDTSLDSLKTLAAQKAVIPIEITQNLKDDGTPGTVEIKTASVPLTSIVTPSMLQVDQMTLRMDMRVQSFDATSGIKFNQNIASAGASYSRGSFGFAVSMANTNVNAQFSNMSDFSSGAVLMSLDIVDRTGFEIPTPLQYGIGASLLVQLVDISQQVTATPPAVVTRVAKISVQKVTSAGPTPLGSGEYGVSLADPNLLFVASSGGTPPLAAGPGELLVYYSPDTAAAPYKERKGTIIFGQLTKEFTFHL